MDVDLDVDIDQEAERDPEESLLNPEVLDEAALSLSSSEEPDEYRSVLQSPEVYLPDADASKREVVTPLELESAMWLPRALRDSVCQNNQRYAPTDAIVNQARKHISLRVSTTDPTAEMLRKAVSAKRSSFNKKSRENDGNPAFALSLHHKDAFPDSDIIDIITCQPCMFCRRMPHRNKCGTRIFGLNLTKHKPLKAPGMSEKELKKTKTPAEIEVNRVMEGWSLDVQFLHGSVDRELSSKGYSKDNCQAACTTCNMMKGTMTNKEFIRQCQLVSHVADSRRLAKHEPRYIPLPDQHLSQSEKQNKPRSTKTRLAESASGPPPQSLLPTKRKRGTGKSAQ